MEKDWLLKKAVEIHDFTVAYDMHYFYDAIKTMTLSAMPTCIFVPPTVLCSCETT